MNVRKEIAKTDKVVEEFLTAIINLVNHQDKTNSTAFGELRSTMVGILEDYHYGEDAGNWYVRAGTMIDRDGDYEQGRVNYQRKPEEKRVR